MRGETMMHLAEVLQAYTEAAVWSSADADGTPLDQSDADLAPETLRLFKTDCARFMADHADLVDRAMDATGRGAAQLGHDLWLTRNRHGAGFWDGDWGEFGDLLTDAAHKMGECDLYVGDDGLIYAA